MKQNEILSKSYSDNELKDFLRNKIIHFKQLIKNPEIINNNEDKDINLLDSFCISFENNEADQNLLLKKEDVKYSLKDFDSNGFNPANSKQNINIYEKFIDNQNPILIEEYRCKLSDIDNTDIFQNVLVKVYSDFYYFNINNHLYGIMQNVKDTYVYEFKISELFNSSELMRVLIFFSGLNDENCMIIGKNEDNDFIELPIYIAENISKKINLLGEVISKIVTIENDMISSNFILPKIISKKDIDVINELYLIITENIVATYHKISYNNLHNDLTSTILNKGFVHFKAGFNANPSLNYSLFGYSILIKIEGIL
ncbi:hypothetical protein K8R66_00870, partial [bacterium]|nr:hypothetical protein [bacterium]